MAELANKFRVKKDGVEHECTCYTIEEEATPTTIPGGSAWEIKNNGVVCYIGLWPTSENGGEFHTPLRLKKNGVEYYIETKVLNNFTVTITQSQYQTIKVTCNGTIYTESFSAPAGSSYTVSVEPYVGYTAGEPSSISGYINSNINITASPASKATYLVTIEQTEGQTIKVTCNGIQYTSNFTAEHGDTWTATLEVHEGYNIGSLLASSGTITKNTTISATPAEVIKYTITAADPDNGDIAVNGVVGTLFSVNHGSSVTIEAIPNDGYDPVLYVDDYDAPMMISFTLTGYELTTATYQAEYGMSVTQWLQSSYNTSEITEWFPETSSDRDYYYWTDTLGNYYDDSYYGDPSDPDYIILQDGVTYTRSFYKD